MALVNPVPSGRLTDRYGPRGTVAGVGDLGFHTGDDIAAAAGTPILAAHNGVITRVYWDAFANGAGAGGNMVEIRGDDGFLTRYAHMIRSSPLAVGARVVAGQTVIGNVGQTGAANGDHLHFEVLAKGSFVAPWQYVATQPAAPIRKDSRMHAVRQIGQPDSGVIIGAGQPPRARTNSVFVAECAALGITPVDCPDWQYGTVVREAWADFNTSARLIADAVAGKVGSGGSAPIGVTPADAEKIAKAVNDEAAKRLKS